MNNTISDNQEDPDHQAIRALIATQFESLAWTPKQDGDWERFGASFLPCAHLFDSRRPAQPQSVTDFIMRMRGLRDDGTLANFSEKGNGCEIVIIGNIAVALAGCEMTENCSQVTRDISALLLVKDPDGWKIAAQAWDIVCDIEEAFSDAFKSASANRP